MPLLFLQSSPVLEAVRPFRTAVHFLWTYFTPSLTDASPPQETHHQYAEAMANEWNRRSGSIRETRTIHSFWSTLETHFFHCGLQFFLLVFTLCACLCSNHCASYAVHVWNCVLLSPQSLCCKHAHSWLQVFLGTLQIIIRSVFMQCSATQRFLMDNSSTSCSLRKCFIPVEAFHQLHVLFTAF